MSSTINFSVIAPNYSRPIVCQAGNYEEMRKFVQATLLTLKPEQWLLAEPVGDFPWPLVSHLRDLPCAADGFEQAAQNLSEALGDSAIVDSGFPQFSFEYSRLAFRDPGFSNGSSLGILAWVSETPLLVCEDGYDNSFGIVPMKEIASYQCYSDSAGAPISWSGGANLIQVNSRQAISFGTGDSAPDQTIWDWSLHDELDDEHAKTLVSWLRKYNLIAALAWSATNVGGAHEASNREILQQIVQGETSGLVLSLNLAQKELDLVIEYCPQANDLFLPIRNMLRSNNDELLRDLFIFFGLRGLLFDGGRRIEEAYRSYDEARRTITKYFLLPKSLEENLPNLARTREVIARLEGIQNLDAISDKIGNLAESEDQGLRIAGILISREKSLSKQHDLVANLQSAFKTWESWRIQQEHLPTLLEPFLGK